MTAEWIMAIAAVLTLVFAVVAVMWKFSKSVDRNTILTQQIAEGLKSQWGRIDEHKEVLEQHGERLVKLETRLDYQPGANSVAAKS